MRSAGSDAAVRSAVASPCQAGPRRRPVPAAGPGTGVNARGEQDKLWLGDEQDGTTRRFPGTKPPRLVHELTASQREGESIWGQRAGAALGAGDPTTADTAQTPPQAAQGGTSRASCRGGARAPPDPDPGPAWASTAWGAPPSPTAMRASAFPGFVRSHSPKLLAHLWDQKTPRSISPIVQPWAFDVILNGATAVRPQPPRGARSRSVGFPHPPPGALGPAWATGGPCHARGACAAGCGQLKGLGLVLAARSLRGPLAGALRTPRQIRRAAGPPISRVRFELIRTTLSCFSSAKTLPLHIHLMLN